MSSLKSLIKTTPHDKKHFPATNQYHYCWYFVSSFPLIVLVVHM